LELRDTVLLDVKQINVSYGNIHALRDVSLKVESGEIVTIIGANGAGKSTILKTLVGLLRSQTGDILFEGRSIAALPPAAIVSHGIALVPEGRRVFPRLSVLDNLLLGAYGHKKSERAESLSRIFAMFPRLAERKSQLAGTLSGGEQQMLAIGRALMSRPRLLLLDEPSMGLAPVLVNQIFETILDINSQGTTLLLVEQNAHLALAIADRGYVLETGAIVLTGNADALAENEQVRYAYLGE
jgi:branched-chain amino acid transport system ATP-binding protein